MAWVQIPYLPLTNYVILDKSPKLSMSPQCHYVQNWTNHSFSFSYQVLCGVLSSVYAWEGGLQGEQPPCRWRRAAGMRHYHTKTLGWENKVLFCGIGIIHIDLFYHTPQNTHKLRQKLAQCRIACDCKRLKTTQITMNRGLVKLITAQLYSNIGGQRKKEWSRSVLRWINH